MIFINDKKATIKTKISMNPTYTTNTHTHIQDKYTHAH